MPEKHRRHIEREFGVPIAGEILYPGGPIDVRRPLGLPYQQRRPRNMTPDTPSLVLEGTLTPDGTLQLDQRPNLPAGRVRVTVQPLSPAAPPGDTLMSRMRAVWDAQKARGHVPRSREEIDADLNALRDEAEEEMQAVERLSDECRRARDQEGTKGPPQ
jgi:hypothetical protein